MARNFELVGSGSRLSPTGSQYTLSLQGVNAHADDVYFPSLLPRVRQGAPMALWRRGEKISDKYFDDTISVPHSGSNQNLRGENDVKLSLRVNFDWEKLNFGQAPTVQQGEAYVETNRFSAVDYIQASEETMWPVNLFNLGSLLEHEFDGVIEPFDIKGELLGLVRSRFEGHAVRAGLTGGASETYFGSKQIVDTWRDSDEKCAFFLDAPLTLTTIPIGAYSNITHEPDSAWLDESALDITNFPIKVHNPLVVAPANVPYSIFANPMGSRWSKLHNIRYDLPTSDGLLAWWRLNRDLSITGNAIDSSGNGRAGTFDAAVNRPGYALSTLPPYVQTHDAVFTGMGDRASITAGNDWNNLIGGSGATAKPFSIVCRFKSNGMGGDGVPTIVSIGLADRYLGAESASNKLIFSIPGSSPVSIEVSSAYNTGRWYHVVATYAGGAAGGAMELYIDGVSRGNAVQSSADAIAAYSWIGGNTSPHPSINRSWNGSIADVSIWDRILTIDEVRALRDASNGVYENKVQEDLLMKGLRSMAAKGNTSSSTIDPAEKRATHGFYFGQNAGSIVYGDEGNEK